MERQSGGEKMVVWISGSVGGGLAERETDNRHLECLVAWFH